MDKQVHKWKEERKGTKKKRKKETKYKAIYTARQQGY